MSSTPRLIGTLIVVVLKARNLPNKRHIGKQDPYCTLKLHNEAKKTKPVKRGGQHPEWDEEIRFELFEDVEDELARTAKGGATPPVPPKDKPKERKVRGGKSMRLLCYADDPREPELIGETVVDLSEVLTKGETDEWFTLMNKDKYSGEIYLELTFWSNEKPPEKSHSAQPSRLHPQYGGPGSFTPSGDEGGRTSSTGSSPAPANRIPAHGRQGSTPTSGGKPSTPTSSSLSQLNLYIPPYDRDPVPHHRPYDPSMEFGDPSRRRESYPPRNAPQQTGYVYQSAYGPNPYDVNITVPQPDPYASASPSSAYYQTSQSAQYTSNLYSQNTSSFAPSGFVPPQPTMTPQPSGFQPVYSGFSAPHPSATPVPSYIPPSSSMGFHNFQNPVGYPSQTPAPQVQPQMPPFQHHSNSYPAANPPANPGLSTLQVVPPGPSVSAPPVQAFGAPHQQQQPPQQQAPISYQQLQPQTQQGQGRPLPDQPPQQPITFPTASPFNHGPQSVQTQLNSIQNQNHAPNPPVGTGFVAPPPPPPIQAHRASSLPVPGVPASQPVTSSGAQLGYGATQILPLPPTASPQQVPPGTISANNTGGSGRSGLPLPPLPNPPAQTQSALYIGAPAPSATPLPGPPPPLPKPPAPQGFQHTQQASYGGQSNIGYAPQQPQQQQYATQSQYQSQAPPQGQVGGWQQAPQNYTNGGFNPGQQYGPGQQTPPTQAGENVRIVTSKVHPLDSSSTPYAFSSTAVPLLHKAARSLNLPPRSNKSYYTFLGIPPPTPPAASPADPSSSRRAAAAAPLPLSVTGEINVSNFHICFILPRILPTRGAILADSNIDRTPRLRRGSLVEGKNIVFMAGVEIFVPFLSRPPRSPYQLSLPLPRCLSNHIKLRVASPERKSSGEDPPPWDLSSDPIVSYKPSYGSRSTSYEQMADDEISLEDSVEASTHVSSIGGVQGTFPSTDRIRIRWAAPLSRSQGPSAPSDGRHRIGVEEANGFTHCTILGMDGEGRAKIKFEYEGICKGLWFPGVAIQVGLDVMLDGKGRNITWAGDDNHWEVSGDATLTGVDGAHTPTLDHEHQLEEVSSRISHSNFSLQRTSSYAGSSLMQTALPTNSLLPDYSFETTPSPTVSMINSTGTPYGNSSASSAIILPKEPNKPITLFLNIGSLPPPPKNEFHFKISGIILVENSRKADPDDDEDDDALELPTLKVLPAQKSRTEFSVTSEMREPVEVILPQEKRPPRSGLTNGAHTPPIRRKTLKRRTTLRADNGISIVMTPRKLESPRDSPISRYQATPRRAVHDSPIRMARTPKTPRAHLISSPASRGSSYPIPWVRASVTLLPTSQQHSHAVQFTVPVVAVTDGVLSFGVCIPSSLANGGDAAIEIVSATADGMNLPVEVFPRGGMLEDDADDPEVYERNMKMTEFTTASGELKKEEINDMALRDMDSWVRVVAPEKVVGNLELHYLVARDPAKPSKKITSRGEQLAILLPSFHLSVGTYTANIHTPRGYKDPLLLSNFHQQEDGRISHYRLPGYFYPQVRVQIEAIQQDAGPGVSLRIAHSLGWLLRRLFEAIPVLTSLAILWFMFSIREEVRDMRVFSNLPLSWTSSQQQAQADPTQDAATPAAVVTATDGPISIPYTPRPTSSAAELAVLKQFASLMPIPLGMLHRLDWTRFSHAFMVSMEKLIGFLQAVLQFPAPP
ncbi:hypothetical protein FRC17_002628 [Serendipita sp. 399]|nr:hypothetical protein FRC17_002628 [Serendipita sp. 399]